MVKIEILRKGQAVSSDGTEVDLDDELLDQVVESYDPDTFKAPLIVSHDTGDEDDASLADSELAYGYPVRLERVGDRVQAIFERISPQFVEWNREGRLLGISPSLYPPTSQANPTPGLWSLRHIAGLGKNPPAIKGLTPLALSELTNQENWILSMKEFSQPDTEAMDFSYDANADTLSSVASTIIALDKAMADEAPADEAVTIEPPTDEDKAVALILEVAQRMSGEDVASEQNYDALVAAAKTILDVAAQIAMPEEPEEDHYDAGEDCETNTSHYQAMKALKMLMKLMLHAGQDVDFGGGHNKNKRSKTGSYSYAEPTGKAMPEQERDELELLRAEREALKAEVKAARIESLVSFCEAHQDRFTPAMKAPATIEFGEESLSMDAVDFMAGLSGPQLAWFKSMVKSLPSQVEFKEVASSDSDPGQEDEEFNFEERLTAAKLALQNSFNAAGGIQ